MNRRAAAQDRCPGASELHPAGDGHLARVRLPGGYLRADQLRALAAAAAGMGDGNLELTSRGNIQLRGLAPDAGPALAARLATAGLLPSATHERVRNIVASASDDAFVRTAVSDLDRFLCADPVLAGLSGRFLFTIDDGSRDVSGLDGDVGLVALDAGTVALFLAGDDTGLRCGPEQAVTVALAAARAFLAASSANPAATIAADSAATAATVAAETGRDTSDGPAATAWRVSELDSAARAGCVEAVAAGSTGAAWRVAAGPTRPAPPYRPPLGAQTRPDPTGARQDATDPATHGTAAIGVAAPLGRLSQKQAGVLARLGDAGTGELRVTPWRTILVRGLAESTLDNWLAVLAAAGLVVDAAAPLARVSACAGRPGCARSLADVRTDAVAVHATSPPGTARLPVHWSGCARDCGRPVARHVRVRATDAGYDVILDGAVISTVDIPAALGGVLEGVSDR